MLAVILNIIKGYFSSEFDVTSFIRENVQLFGKDENKNIKMSSPLMYFLLSNGHDYESIAKLWVDSDKKFEHYQTWNPKHSNELILWHPKNKKPVLGSNNSAL